jgi:hypothetical protein
MFSATTSFENRNAYDWDISAGPILVFNDPNTNEAKVLTVDRAGYGYLIDPSNMCNGSSCTGNVSGMSTSFKAGDRGNLFHFAAAQTPCAFRGVLSAAQDCDRVTSLAAFKDNNGNTQVFMWPFNEDLMSVQLSDNSSHSGTGVISYDGSSTITVGGVPAGAKITGSGCSTGYVCPSQCYGTCTASTACTGSGGTCGSCLLSSLIPGVQITLNGQIVTVTYVQDDQTIAVSPAPTSSFSNLSFSYNGYLVNPSTDHYPIESTLGYPGGSMSLTSKSDGSQGVVWSLVSKSGTYETIRGAGILEVHGTTPNFANLSGTAPFYGGSLTRIWNSDPTNTDFWCASSFVPPTVVNGQVFVATYAAPANLTNGPCPATASPFTGNPVRSAVLQFKCNGTCSP